MIKKQIKLSTLIRTFESTLQPKSTVAKHWFRLGIKVGLYFYFWKEYWRHSDDMESILADMRKVIVPESIQQTSSDLMDIFVEVD